jgi:sulfate adenylyltransferase subunit 1 (EFTu-like GTPase family)
MDTQYRAFAKELGIEKIYSVPISALEGDNVVARSVHTPWYEGKTLIEHLEEVPLSAPSPDAPFRMAIQYVNRPNLDFRGFAGTIASGSIRVGESITALPSGKKATVKAIVTYDGELESASTAQAITLTLKEEIDIGRGDIIIKTGEPISASDAITANLVWMDEEPFYSL